VHDAGASVKSSTFGNIIIFCDGACTGNPGPGGWGAIVATPDGQVHELGNGAPQTTNNRMEMIAVISALEYVKDQTGPVAVYTDSVYVIRGITQWIWGWKSRGWKTANGDEVANQDLWEWMHRVVSARKGKSAIEWHYVRGHVGIAGNERVDEIAVEYAAGRKPRLYSGPLIKYSIPIHDIPDDTSLPEMKERPAKVAAHSYLSLVDGQLRRHADWKDCESLVKGRSGAKFKKATSAADEKNIVESWGKRLSDIKD
jgi:ribonuclease HI